MPYKDILPVYIENRVKHINKNTALQIIKVGDLYIYIVTTNLKRLKYLVYWYIRYYFDSPVFLMSVWNFSHCTIQPTSY
jgi:hypothetical protein